MPILTIAYQLHDVSKPCVVTNIQFQRTVLQETLFMSDIKPSWTSASVHVNQPAKHSSDRVVKQKISRKCWTECQSRSNKVFKRMLARTVHVTPTVIQCACVGEAVKPYTDIYIIKNCSRLFNRMPERTVHVSPSAMQAASRNNTYLHHTNHQSLTANMCLTQIHKQKSLTCGRDDHRAVCEQPPCSPSKWHIHLHSVPGLLVLPLET